MSRRRPELDDDGQPTHKQLAAARLSDRAVDELIGLCRGVMADEKVNMLEARAMHRWIDANSDYADQWPFDVIFERLTDVLADGQIDDDEQRDLLDLLVDITGGETPIEERVASYATSLPLTDPSPDLDFPGRRYCLTGKFLFGSRKKCEEAIEARGGTPTSTVSTITDYLVIGAMGSSQWLHSTHGTKIEAALFHDIAVVHEGHWHDWLERFPPAFPVRKRFRRIRRRTLVPGQEVFSMAMRAGESLAISHLGDVEREELAQHFEINEDMENEPGLYAITYTGTNPLLKDWWYVRLAEDDRG